MQGRVIVKHTCHHAERNPGMSVLVASATRMPAGGRPSQQTTSRDNLRHREGKAATTSQTSMVRCSFGECAAKRARIRVEVQYIFCQAPQWHGAFL